MMTLNVVRAGRKQNGYMEKLIVKMFRDKRNIFKRGYGVCDIGPECIVNSFYSVRNTYCKINMVKVHYMELFADYQMGREMVKMIADRVGYFLYDCGYQNYIVVIDLGERFMVGIAVNSVSYKRPDLFKDNNQWLLELYQFICGLVPANCTVNVTQNSIFLPETQEGNYVHGLYG